jgi:hypothetical protein
MLWKDLTYNKWAKLDEKCFVKSTPSKIEFQGTISSMKFDLSKIGEAGSHEKS